MMDKPQSAIARLGNLVINTHGNKKDKLAWGVIKEYIYYLEHGEDDDVEFLCPHCSGSGEGMHDGTSCALCKGSGTEKEYE